MRTYFFSLIVALSIIITGCEDQIDITLDEGTSQLSIDAFITNEQKPQIIRLTKTSGYFDNSSSPAAQGATVKITDNNTGKIYHFIDSNSTGNYTWTPGTFDTLIIGNQYALSVMYLGEEYSAASVMNPVPAIDSITSVYKTVPIGGGKTATGYFASFYARDFAGRTDFYWIKTYKNGVLNKNPSNINIAWDAAFGPGANGFTFILPIRDAITPQDNPFQLNDSVFVEIHAINEETWNFLSEVRTQTTNGGLFATPPANVRTNIKNIHTDSKIKPVGFFNIGAVSSSGKRIKK